MQSTSICLSACNQSAIRIQNPDNTDPAITEFYFRERIFPSECNQLNINCNSHTMHIAIEFRNRSRIQLQSTVAPIIIACEPIDLQWHYGDVNDNVNNSNSIVDNIYCYTPGNDIFVFNHLIPFH